MGIHWPPPYLLSHSFRLVVYGIHFVGKGSLGGIEMVLFGWWSLIVWCGAFGGREITGTLSIQKKTVLDLKLFLFKTLMDWVAVLGFHSVFSVDGLMDTCTVCTWLCFVPCVYFLYTQVTFLFSFLNIFFITHQKKFCDLSKVEGCFSLAFFMRMNDSDSEIWHWEEPLTGFNKCTMAHSSGEGCSRWQPNAFWSHLLWTN